MNLSILLFFFISCWVCLGSNKWSVSEFVQQQPWMPALLTSVHTPPKTRAQTHKHTHWTNCFPLDTNRILFWSSLSKNKQSVNRHRELCGTRKCQRSQTEIVWLMETCNDGHITFDILWPKLHPKYYMFQTKMVSVQMSVYLHSRFRFHVKTCHMTIQHSFIWIRNAHAAVNRKWTTGCFMLEIHWWKYRNCESKTRDVLACRRSIIKCWLWLWTSLSVSKFPNVFISAIQTKMQPWSFQIETRLAAFSKIFVLSM